MKKQFFITFIFSLLLIFGVSAQIPTYVPTDGLVGWWPFNGNANDESGNGNDGVAYGATLSNDRFGIPNKSYDFSGSNWISIDHNSLLNFNSTFTIGAWCKADSIYPVPGYPATILSKHTWGSPSGYVFSIGGTAPNDVPSPNEGRINFQASPNYNYMTLPQSNESIVSSNQWYNLAITYSGTSGLLKYFVNGLLVDSISITFDANINSNSLVIGALSYDGFNGGTHFFNGKIDDIGIWNRALTQEEIKNLYYGSSPYTCNIDSLLNPAINYGSVTDIDGNVYPTVTIKGREWMAQNLRTTRFANGDMIPNITQENDWINMTTSAWCYYFNDSIYNCPYGKLYNWFALRDQRNICPQGWHVMTATDWEDLVNGINNHKDWLNSSIGWGQNLSYKNESGMSIIPGGMRGNNAGGAGEINKFLALNETAWFGRPNANPWRHAISLNNGGQYLTGANGYTYNNFFTEVSGTSVRCVQNIKNQCDIIESISPGISYATVGDTKQLTALLNDTLSMFQWQYSTSNHDWIDAVNPGKFGAPTSSNLTLKNINIGDNLLRLRLIAKNNTCFDTSNVAVVLIKDTCFLTISDTILTTISDTIFTTISDTILTTVMDTLLIDVVLSNTADPTSNLIRVYPNPTLSHLVIDAGTYTLMSGYTLTITNGNGATIWTESFSQPVYTLDMSGWSGKGLYYITLSDPQGNIVTTRKIILQ